MAAQKPPTTLRLCDGEQIDLTPAQVERAFDELWLIGWKMKGAVSAAAKLKRVDAWNQIHGEDPLSAEETAALREALRRVYGRD